MIDIQIGPGLHLQANQDSFLLTRACTPDAGSVGIEMSDEEAGRLAYHISKVRQKRYDQSHSEPDWSAT